MPLINCEVDLILTQSSTYFITNSAGAGRFEITDTKLYVLVVTLSTQDNTKLLQQLKSCFKKAINWNKYQSDPKTYARNQYLNQLIDPSFQRMNIEIVDDRRSHLNQYLPKVEVKYYNVMIGGKNFFDHPINNDFKTFENIRKISTGQGDDYTTGCLLGYLHFKETYKMIPIDLSKEKTLDADPRAIQESNFTANFDTAGNTTMFFIIEEAKEIVLDFSQGNLIFINIKWLNIIV